MSAVLRAIVGVVQRMALLVVVENPSTSVAHELHQPVLLRLFGLLVLVDYLREKAPHKLADPVVRNRLAELQLRILWEEILNRFEKIEIQDEPERSFSPFVKGYTHLPVKVTRKQA